MGGGLATASILVSVLGGICMLIAGIFGLANCRRPEKAQLCLILGIAMIAIQVISLIVVGRINAWASGLGASQGFSFTYITGFIIPVLYIIAALQLKSNLNNSDYNTYA